MSVECVKSLNAIGLEYYVCEYNGQLFYGHTFSEAITNAVKSLFIYA